MSNMSQLTLQSKSMQLSTTEKLAHYKQNEIIWISREHLKHDFSLATKRSAMQDWWLNTQLIIIMITNDTRQQGNGYEHCLPTATAAKQSHIKNVCIVHSTARHQSDNSLISTHGSCRPVQFMSSLLCNTYT